MIRIIKSGILDTIQDNGRVGFARWGVNTNGAMDRFALAAANILVGNPMEKNALEIHFPAPEIQFCSAAVVTFTGADFAPEINGQSVPLWKTIEIPAGAVVRFSRKVKGMRCYLAVHGAFDVAEWLGSASTNLRSNTGGFEGRALRKGDEIKFKSGVFDGKVFDSLRIFPWSVNPSFVYDDDSVLVIPGNELNWLDERSRTKLFTETISIEPSSDRMASYLRHEPLQFARHEQLLSGSVSFGTIQALPSGKLCVLMADHQTTGGYPRVAHIASAHLPKFAQISPGQQFSFLQTSTEDAEKMLLSLYGVLNNLSRTLFKKLSDHYGIDRS